MTLRISSSTIVYIALVDQVGEQVIVLCRKNVTIIADFDSLCYDAKNKEMYYEGEPLSEELRFKFQKKRCTLEFDPYEKQEDTELWVERRKAMLSYLHQGWTLLDSAGHMVSFVNVEELETKLNPECLWLPTRQSAPVTSVLEQKLTIDGFRKELNELIVKYTEVFGTSK